jgi:ribosomal protein S18 acetylase RimI-like enzyme
VPLERGGLEDASRVLARAFGDDPAWKWILPRAARRERVLPWLFRTALAATLEGGRVETTEDVRGVALWIPPGPALLDVNRAARRSILAVPFRLREAYGRFRAYTQWNFDLQRRAHPGPALFLSGLAVDPAFQGRGIGGALLEAGIARDSSLPVVLLTNSERNVGFYERRGFEVVLDEPMPSGLPTWAMVRQP